MADPKNTWWLPVWRGLIVDPDGKHYRRLKGALWLLLYFFFYADWGTGVVRYSPLRIAQRTGFPRRTIERWMQQLKAAGYVSAVDGGKSVQFSISKWKTLARHRHTGTHHRQFWYARPPKWRNEGAPNHEKR